MIRKSLFFAAVFLSTFVFSGCAVKISSNYPPSILLDGKGQVSINDFNFAPDGYEFDSTKGKYFKASTDVDGNVTKYYIESYQIDTKGGLNPFYLDKSISQFVTEAVKKEFKFIGYKDRPEGRRIIGGEVKELSVDYIGLSTVDFVTKINFIVLNEDSGIKFSKICEGKYSSSKFTTFEPSVGINASLSKAIEEFVRSAQANGVL